MTTSIVSGFTVRYADASYLVEDASGACCGAYDPTPAGYTQASEHANRLSYRAALDARAAADQAAEDSAADAWLARYTETPAQLVERVAYEAEQAASQERDRALTEDDALYCEACGVRVSADDAVLDGALMVCAGCAHAAPVLAAPSGPTGHGGYSCGWVWGYSGPARGLPLFVAALRSEVA